MKFKTICNEAYGSWDEAGYTLVKDAVSWQDAWNKLYQNLSPIPSLPRIDFANQQVLIYRMGTRPSGGYAVDVKAIVSKGKELHVTVLEQKPGPGCMTTMAIVNPFVVVSFPKTTQSDIHINRQTAEKPCR